MFRGACEEINDKAFKMHLCGIACQVLERIGGLLYRRFCFCGNTMLC